MSQMSAAEAEEYRRPVIEALGPDDPFEVQAGEVDLWRRVLETAGASLRTRPAEGEWSVIECLGHMVDSELVTSARYRWVLAEDEPPLQGYDQEAWTARFDHAHDDPALLLDLLCALRNSNLSLWNRATLADRIRTGIHAERGPESFELLFRLQAGHGRVHRAQAEQALATIRRAKWLSQPYG
jgi:DinB superfamily